MFVGDRNFFAKTQAMIFSFPKLLFPMDNCHFSIKKMSLQHTYLAYARSHKYNVNVYQLICSPFSYIILYMYDTTVNSNIGYFHCMLLFGVTMLRAFLTQQYYFGKTSTGQYIRSGLNAAIYRKVRRRE